MVPQEAWHGEGEETPQIEDSIFDRRTGNDDTVFGLEGACGFCRLRLRVLNVLPFVESGDGPFLFEEEGAVYAQLRVVGDEDVDFGCFPGDRLD